MEQVPDGNLTCRIESHPDYRKYSQIYIPLRLASGWVFLDEFLYYTKSDNLDIYFRNNGITYIFKSGDSIPNYTGYRAASEPHLQPHEV